MADIPEGATLIDNPASAAPGFILKNVYVMAGVPSILQSMFEGLRDKLQGGQKKVRDGPMCHWEARLRRSCQMFQTILKAYLLEATRGLNQDSLAPLLLCHQNKKTFIRC